MNKPQGLNERLGKKSLQSLTILAIIFLFFSSSYVGLAKFHNNKQGTIAQTRIQEWKKLIANNKNKSIPVKLKLVNDFFNQFEFRSDAAFIGKSDYWQTPLEFISNGVGDCEDFSIAKYFSLLQLGVPINQLRIIYVKALSLNQAHMVLAYYPTPDADPLILDNLIRTIKPASQRSDLYPVYSFNGEGLWLAKLRGQGQYVGDSTRLSAWIDVQNRMSKEPSP